MQKRTFLYISWASWAFFVVSLIGLHQYLGRPRTSPNAGELKAISSGADDATKNSLRHFESGVLKLDDGRFHLIGSGFESEQDSLLADKRMIERKIEFSVADPVEIERRLMAGEAFRKLNNAEKKCFVDMYAAIVFRNGQYFLYISPAKYAEYVRKYGTECASCDEEKPMKSKSEEDP